VKQREIQVNAFLALVRAGLWEQRVRLSAYEPIDLSVIYDLAEAQSVVGLVAAGVEHVEDCRFTKQEVMPFMESVISIENRNLAMNYFIGVIVDKMREADIYAVLIKGQGVAQCYARPLWRSSGDVDFFLDANNYNKAISYLTPLAIHLESEDKTRLHFGMTINPWVVELHGTMHTLISRRIDSGIDAIQRDIFDNGGVRIWENDAVEVFLPSPNNDIFIVFSHFIDHFFIGGVGLRQISDWCRLLWTYQDVIDVDLLGKRLYSMRLNTVWRSFAAFAVDYLGMPVEAMPCYSTSEKYHRKARRILGLILHSGNFGHNKEESHRIQYPRHIQQIISFFRRLAEFARLTIIFPTSAPSFFLTFVSKRTKASF
jgi:hypothetical protein